MNNCIIAYILAQDGWVNDFKGECYKMGYPRFKMIRKI